MEKIMIQELISGLRAIYGDDLLKITLYGSYAQGNQTEESDIDIAILLKNPEDKKKERQLVKFSTALDLKYDKVFSIIDIDYEQYKRWVGAMPFYKNIEREGITLWWTAE